MDLISIRRNMMGVIAGMAGEWKQKKVVVPSQIKLADAMKTWIQNVLPSATYCVITRDDWTAASNNGTLIIANVEGNNFGGYIRIYNSVYQGAAVWTSSYALSADEGDSYTIFYK